MQGTFNAAQAAHGDGTRELIRRANDLESGPVLRRLGIEVRKGNRWECPECRSYPVSATFNGEDGNPAKRWRCTADKCDAGGSVVDLVAMHTGKSPGNAARFILGMPTAVEDDAGQAGQDLETMVSSHEDKPPESTITDIPGDDAGEFFTSTNQANAVENEVAVLAGTKHGRRKSS